MGIKERQQEHSKDNRPSIWSDRKEWSPIKEKKLRDKISWIRSLRISADNMRISAVGHRDTCRKHKMETGIIIDG